MKFLRALYRDSNYMLRMLYKNRGVLLSVTRLELVKRYSGSVFGTLWVFLQPALLLSIYLFVYMVIFKMRFPGYSQLDYVVYVFTGLVPYIGFMESVNTGCMAVKQNIHLVKNVMLPIELIPARYVAVSMVSQFVSLAMVLVLVIINGSISVHLVWLPIVILLQVMFLLGLVWIVSAIAVALPDISYFMGLITLLLLFISPIGFKPDMVPDSLSFMIFLNPIFYLTEMFRATMVYGAWPELNVVLIYIGMCLTTFAIGATFFRKFKGVLVDYE